MHTREELLSYYNEHKETFSNKGIDRKEHREFKKAVKRLYSFVGCMKGRREFSIYLHCLLEDIIQPPSCVICKKIIETAHSREFPKTCSRKCNGAYVAQETKKKTGAYNVTSESAKAKARETNLEKYGSEHYLKSEKGKSQYKKSMKTRYGVENNFQRESAKEKAKKTLNSRFGVDNPMQSDEIKEKALETVMDRFGTHNPMQSDAVKEKSRKTCLDRYGVEYYSQSDEFKSRENVHRVSDYAFSILNSEEKLRDLHGRMSAVGVARELGVDGTTVRRYMDKHGIDPLPPGVGNFMEKEVYRFVESLGFDIVSGDRSTLDGKEIDILIPELGVGIEFNGLRYHSTYKVPPRYHIDKTELANSKGIRLIHIFEDEWLYRNDQVKSKIKSILGVDDRPVVFARNTQVEFVTDKSEVKELLDRFHIQGSSGFSIGFVLKFDSTVVAAMTFRVSGDGEYELNRYATSSRVVGGLSKLLKYAMQHLKTLGCRRIVSFADRRYSDGDAYTASGWKHEYNTKPDYQYVIGDTRVRKQNFRRKYLSERLENFDPELSEIENMENNGYYRIYDCGLMKFSIQIS